MPQGIPNCPPGLEYLTMIDQLLVHQKVELLEGSNKIPTIYKKKKKRKSLNQTELTLYFTVKAA